jgi:curli biogenesis system outer membrane secretion channel CsgG
MVGFNMAWRYSTVKRKGFLVFFVLLIVALSSTVPIFGAHQLYRIAVLPFDDQSIRNRWWGNQYDVGQEVSSELVTALLDTKQFRLIEREEVQRVLSEQKLSAVNVDPNTTIEFGKLLGVKFLVMGHVTEFSFDDHQGGAFVDPTSRLGFAFKTNTARVAIDARMVDTTTAEIFLGATGVGEKKRTNLGLASGNGEAMMLDGDHFSKSDLGLALRDAVNSVATQFAEKTYSADMDKPLLGVVAYTTPTTVIINIGNTSGVEPGMTFTVEHIIQVIRDPVTKEVIDEISDTVAEITVVEVKDKASVCRITSQKEDIAVNDKVKSKADPTPVATPTPTPQPKNNKSKSHGGKSSLF